MMERMSEENEVWGGVERDGRGLYWMNHGRGEPGPCGELELEGVVQGRKGDGWVVRRGNTTVALRIPGKFPGNSPKISVHL